MTPDASHPCRNTSHRNRLAAILATSALAGLLLLGVSRCNDRHIPPLSVGPPAEVNQMLVERGVVEAADAAPVRMGASGDILEIYPNGTPVTSGTTVLRVDDIDILTRIDDDELNIQLEEIEDTVRNARRDQTLVEQTNRLVVVAMRLKLAEREDAALRAGLGPDDLRLLEIERRLVELDWMDVQEEAERQRRMHSRGFIADAVLDRHIRRETTARAALDEKTLQIQLRRQGTREEDLLESARTIQRYAAELERGESALQRRLARIDSDLEVGRLQLELHRYDLARDSDDLAETVTKADTDGIFRVRTYSNWRVGGTSQPYSAGVHKGKFDTVADIVRKSEFRVDLMIHESDIHRVHVGSPVRLRIGAFPDRTFDARIVTVGGIGRDRQDVAPNGFEDSPAGVTMFNVEVRFENPDGVDVRPGMSAMAEFDAPQSTL